MTRFVPISSSAVGRFEPTESDIPWDTKMKSSRLEAHRLPVVLLADLGDEALAARARELRAQGYLTRRQLDGRTPLRSMRYAIEHGQ